MELTTTTTDLLGPGEIYFSTGKGTWIMKLTPSGARFNHEAYPDLTNDEAANAIINILENNFGIEFKRK